MKNYFFIVLASLFCVMSTSAFADDPKPADNDTDKTQPSIAPNTWYSQPKAVVRVLNKLESSVTVLTIPVNSSAQYKTLTIAVKKCLVRPPAFAADSAAFVTITDSKLSTNPFSAWIFKAEPGDSVFEHPLYNVSIVGCAGEVNDNPVSAKPADTTGAKPEGQNSSNSLEDSLERSIQSQH